MATVSKAIADKVIAGDGWYPGDPRVGSVVEYTTPEGNEAYGVNYGKHNAYTPSPWVINPRVVWEAK